MRSSAKNIIDDFLANDRLIQKYTDDQIEQIRSILFAGARKLNNEIASIKLIGYCSGEFCFIKPFDVSVDNIKSYIKRTLSAQNTLNPSCVVKRIKR